MIMRHRLRHRSPALWILLITFALGVAVATWADETTTEEGRLAALIRQLDAIDRLAQQSAEAAALQGTRYHFDYARLHADIARIRAGVEDYLSPIRAQPRDPQSLSGQYRRDEDIEP
jgi:RAQPRD family integrative conjugative element protein